MDKKLSSAQRLREKVAARLEKAKAAVETAKTPLSRDLRDCRLEELEGRLAHAVGQEVERAALAGAPVPPLPSAVTPRAQKAVEAAAEKALRSGQRQRAWKEERAAAKRLAAERKAAEREANQRATKAAQKGRPVSAANIVAPASVVPPKGKMSEAIKKAHSDFAQLDEYDRSSLATMGTVSSPLPRDGARRRWTTRADEGRPRSNVFDVHENETTNEALRRLGFERASCRCSRCERLAPHDRRRTVRVVDGVEALSCGTPVGAAIEWIRAGCPIAEPAE